MAKYIRLIFAHRMGSKSNGDCPADGATEAKLLFYKGKIFRGTGINDKNAKAKRRPHHVPAA
jgi:hypothetical protein